MDVEKRRKALRQLTYGLYVVTACHDQEYAAATITWLSQCSFRPPLVMAGIQRRGNLHRAIEGAGAFAVHIIGSSQKELATSFFKAAKLAGQTLNGYRFEVGVTSAPVLVAAPAWFECRVLDKVRRGDHTIFIAEVVAAGERRDEAPLSLRDAGFSYGG